MRKFEEVREEFKKYDGETKLPCRGSAKSAGYDFYSKTTVDVQPGETLKMWSDVKVQMEDDEVLYIHLRSSMGGKYIIPNLTGVIDADYYSNPKNDGNIGIFLKNISDEVQHIEKGDRVAQGVFMKYLITDDDQTTTQRIGGIGSTGV